MSVGASAAAWLVQGKEAVAGVDEAEWRQVDELEVLAEARSVVEVVLALACWLPMDEAESEWWTRLACTVWAMFAWIWLSWQSVLFFCAAGIATMSA